MAQSGELVLRDVHVPAAPSWWPPAPGWWIVAGMVLLVALAAFAWLHRRRRRVQAWQRLFDETCAMPQANEQVAVMSELLRRAARRIDRQADTLEGEEWLRFLDGVKSDKGRRSDFTVGAGRLLLDGGFRREVDAGELSAVKSLARARFLELMAGRR